MSNKIEIGRLRVPTIYRPAVHQKDNLFNRRTLGLLVIKLDIINPIYGWLCLHKYVGPLLYLICKHISQSVNSFGSLL
jgi:hypothetical protein